MTTPSTPRTECAAALVSPVGLPVRIPLLVDASFLDADVVYTPTGDAGTALKVRAADLIRHTGAEVLELAHPPITDAPPTWPGAPAPTAVAPVLSAPRLTPVSLPAARSAS
jgi:hypothetical protein